MVNLEALRTTGPAADKPLDERSRKLLQEIERSREMNEGTKEERIAALQAEIARLETELTQPTPLERFDAMSHEEQMAELANVVPDIPPEQRDPAIWRQELERASKNMPTKLRLTLARTQLQKLEAQ